jgi:hypothetical protein
MNGGVCYPHDETIQLYVTCPSTLSHKVTDGTQPQLCSVVAEHQRKREQEAEARRLEAAESRWLW